VRHPPNLRAEKLRIEGGPDFGNNGAFILSSAAGIPLKIIASDGAGWDHLSVSTNFRTPTWEEMEAARKLFFRDDEWAVQYGVPAAVHIDAHPYTLHWWRPQCEAMPRPPAWMVGPTPELAAFARSALGELALPWEEAAAVNRLVGAAPALFAACRLALPHLVNEAAADAVRAALALAEGKERTDRARRL
jgi:hypothetical protein